MRIECDADELASFILLIRTQDVSAALLGMQPTDTDAVACVALDGDAPDGDGDENNTLFGRMKG